MSNPMPNELIGYVAFAVTVVAMLTVGVELQELHMQGGLIASELICILLPGLYVYLSRRKSPGWDFPSLGKPDLPLRWFAWIGLTAAALGIAANVVSGIFIELIPALQEMARAYEETVEVLLQPEKPLDAALGIVAVAIAAPVCEEFLFRGAILTSQRTSEQRLGVILLTNGVLFSALHLNPLSFVALIAVGAFFAHLTVLTRSLWPAIFAHAVLNTVNGVLVPRLIADTGAEAVEPTLLELTAGAAVFVPVVVISWKWGARRITQARGAR